MSIVIKKIKLKNFKKFEEFSVDFDDGLNIIIGDNESGKSTILTAIDLTLGGSRLKIDTLGLENIINASAIKAFWESEKRIEDLPVVFVEIYFNECDEESLFGNINSEGEQFNGIKLECKIDDDLTGLTKELIESGELIFPFEFYKVSFSTFNGEIYSPYKKYMRHLLIDNTLTCNEYTIRQYVKDIYLSHLTDRNEKVKYQSQYRKYKENYTNDVLSNLNSRIGYYKFGIKTDTRSNLETDLIITEDGINIDNKGKGKQVFIKTEFSLTNDQNKSDLILIEEPENHLSSTNTKMLIEKINKVGEQQIILTTHSDRISSRLGLNKCIIVSPNSSTPLLLKNLLPKTSEFFIKAPDNNILEFILSKKVILVEGDAEYILLERFYEYVIGNKPENDSVQIIAINGTGFKNYIDICKIVKVRTAIIRDNDANFQENCINNYADLKDDNFEIFADTNNERRTFEISIYEDNKEICDQLFSPGRRTLSVQDYMLSNKAEASFTLLENINDSFIVPNYIKSAIEWIKE